MFSFIDTIANISHAIVNLGHDVVVNGAAFAGNVIMDYAHAQMQIIGEIVNKIL